MNLLSVNTERDIATAYGTASGPCIEPPELDYLVEDWVLVFQLDDGDDIEEKKEELDKETLKEEYLQASELDFGRDDMEVTYSGPDVNNRLTVEIRIQEEKPCGRRAGVYEKINYYPYRYR